ncbi:MAG: RNA polymerase sigma factor [Thermodesulfobacteriota bacterium]|nr:RNA polymerase sigma factor [Thermodesulfobacteriota bacterium]
MQDDNFPKPSDAEVVRQVLDGSVDRFELLLTRHKDQVLKVVGRHVPYHEVQETAHLVFIKAYQSLGTFKGKGHFVQWLSKIAVRTCYDYWRQHYKTREVPIGGLSERQEDWLEKVMAEESAKSFYEDASRREAREFLDWALDALSPEERMVLELVYLEGLSGREAAELLGWSVANVKIRSFRARKKLQKVLASVMKGQEER